MSREFRIDPDAAGVIQFLSAMQRLYASYRLAVTQGDLYVLAIHPVCRRRQAGHSVHNALAILSHVQENQRFCVIYDFLCIIFAIYIWVEALVLPPILFKFNPGHTLLC